MSGYLQMEIAIQYFWRKALQNDHETFWFANYCREDYIRDTKYERLLFNYEEWTPRPSIEFITGISPVILTCQNHSGGTKKYIHPPSKTEPVSSL